MALVGSLESKKVVAPIPQLGDGTVGPGLVRELDSHLQCDDRPRKDGRARVMAAISGYLLSLPPLTTSSTITITITITINNIVLCKKEHHFP